MTENELFTAIRTELLTGLDLLNIQANVKRDYQPRQQGASINPSIYMHIMPQVRYGYLGRVDIANGDSMLHQEIQQYETTIQFTGQVLENPSNLSQLTSVDILNEAAYVLQSDRTRLALRDKGIAVLRITDIIHTFAIDDQDRNQSTPSFDLTVNHQQIKQSTSPITVSVELKQYKV